MRVTRPTKLLHARPRHADSGAAVMSEETTVRSVIGLRSRSGSRSRRYRDNPSRPLRSKKPRPGRVKIFYTRCFPQTSRHSPGCRPDGLASIGRETTRNGSPAAAVMPDQCVGRAVVLQVQARPSDLPTLGTMRWASTLPNSTPHWSNESMFQITPCVKTLCSYRAMSLPRTFRVSGFRRRGRSMAGCLRRRGAARARPWCPRP